MLSQLLVVEDDPHLGPLLREYLSADYQVYHAATLKDAQSWLGTHSAQLILLDLNLPDGDGLDLVQSLRQYSSTPVLVLSARSGVQERVAGLNAGADDYLTKPFAMPELDARIGALLRRTAAGTGVNLGNTSLSSSSLTLTVGEHSAILTEHEARILELMMRTPERVFSRARTSNRTCTAGRRRIPTAWRSASRSCVRSWRVWPPICVSAPSATSATCCKRKA